MEDKPCWIVPHCVSANGAVMSITLCGKLLSERGLPCECVPLHCPKKKTPKMLTPNLSSFVFALHAFAPKSFHAIFFFSKKAPSFRLAFPPAQILLWTKLQQMLAGLKNLDGLQQLTDAATVATSRGG